MRQTKYTVKPTSRFRRDYKLALRRHLNVQLLNEAIEMLATGRALPERYKDHDLSGNWTGHRECHIQPDWLLIYRIEDDILVLTLARTGTQ